MRSCCILTDHEETTKQLRKGIVMTRKKTLVDKIERILWKLICSGGGNGETIRRTAENIARLVEKEQ
jgi:hypothetical protein